MKPPPAKGEVTRRSKRRRRHARAPTDATTARQNASPGEEYRVGPGHPPREFQFKPGVSGNPKGAKPKSKVLRDLKVLFERALNKKVKLRPGERTRIITKLEAGLDQLGDQWAKGDRYARRDVFYYAEKLGIDLTASQGNARHADVSNEAEFWQAVRDRGIPLRLLPPIDEAGAEPPPDPPLPPDEDESER